MKKQRNKQSEINAHYYTACGYKRVPFSGNLWAMPCGAIFNEHTHTTTTPRNIITLYGRIARAKVILWAFQGITPRKGKIMHKNGNKSDYSPLNLCYTLDLLPSEIERAPLVDYNNYKLAIRCYYTIERRDKSRYSDYIEKFRIQGIVNSRGFAAQNTWCEYYRVFAAWLADEPNSTNLSASQRRKVVRYYINKLINEIMNDIAARVLFVGDYSPTKRERAAREKKIITEYFAARGLPMPKPIPKTEKAALKRFREYSKKIKDT